MKILFVASEVAPFLKTGGLADVAYALPKELKKTGVDVRVILPKYGKIAKEYKDKMINLAEFNVKLGWRNQYCGLEYLKLDGIDFYFLDSEFYFKRGEPYGHYDDGEIFSFFSLGVLEAIKHMGNFIPDVIHCNDWHSGIIPLLLREQFKQQNIIYQNIKTVYTIHNLKYQGVFSPKVLGELLSLGEEFFAEDKAKFFDGVSFMKAGIMYADKVTTVSESYSEEIKTPFYGEKLEGLLEGISFKLSGIVNGIDYEENNPETDKFISENYNVNTLNKKTKNKLELQKTLGLPQDRDIPMIGLVSRFVPQKGLDLVAHVIEEILSLDIQFVVLGNGEKEYEGLFKYYSEKYPTKLYAYIGFDNKLAKKIYASSDMFLMPSLFEPCGIGQLIALRYGTIPLVRETGGLQDTVIPYNKYTGEGNGYSFRNYNAHEMLTTIEKAVELFKNKEAWRGLQVNAMTSEISWKESALKYKSLYEELI